VALLEALLLGSVSASKGDLWEVTNHLGLIANLMLYAIFGAIFGATPLLFSHFDKKWRGIFAILSMWEGHRGE
jgi:hypothetical protein